MLPDASSLRPMLAWRYALRDIRHGLKGFRLFIICLFLGVTVIGSVGLLSSIVRGALENNARSLLGGDYELYMSYTGMNDEQQAFIERDGELSLAIELRTIATAGEAFQLVELKAVDNAYPLFGTVTLEPNIPLQHALQQGGIVVEPELLERFNASVGDTLTLGGKTFTIRAVIVSEPDRIVNTFSFGPRALMNADLLKTTTLLQPGSLVRYRYRVALHDDVAPSEWLEKIDQTFPEAAWRIRDFKAAAPQVERVLDNLTLFLTLTGLTALLAGGVGISNSVNALMQRKFFTIATLKSIGATNAFIFWYYLMVILLVSLMAIAGALCAAMLIVWQGTGFINQLIHLDAVFSIQWAPLVRAILFGLLITLTFSLWQLGKVNLIKPAAIFRGKLGLSGWPSRKIIAINLLFGLLLTAFAILTADNRTVAMIYVVSTGLTVLAFFFCSTFFVRVVSRLRPQRFWIRHGLANLYRPGARTLPSIISLGIGLTFLVGISLIDANIQQSIREVRPQDAPTHFFIDIQPNQQAGFVELIESIGGRDIDIAPMLRGNIVALNGTPVQQVDIAPEVRWAIRGDRGISDANRLPRGTTLLAGEWWPEQYRDAPLISFDQRLATGMGLTIGDTMTFNVLGEEITATIANLREVNYQNFRMNFSIILSPGVLDAFPRSYIATASLPFGNDLLSALARDYPNVSPIAVDRAVAQVSALSDNLALAIRMTAIFTILSALVVLTGAIVANEEQRVYDIVLLKVMGAKRWDIIKTYLVEYTGIAMISGIISVAAGTAISWYVIDEFRFFTFAAMPEVSLTIMTLSLILILLIGISITLRSFGRKPLSYLRNE